MDRIQILFMARIQLTTKKNIKTKNMDLKKYNQRLLAVIGTGALLAVAIGLIAALVSLVSSFNFGNDSRRDNGIVIDQNQVVDTNTTSFVQAISILEPYQLDTIEPVFVVPIGQKDQEHKIRSIATAGLSFRSYESESDYYYNSFSGLYNNFVLIDYTRDIKIPIFSSKIALTEWAYLKIGESRLILFKGTDTDLNEDGLLNNDDFQSLYVYDVQELKLTKLDFDNQTVRDFEPLSLTSKIYVRTGIDINDDKKFKYASEPTDLYIYDVKTGEKETLVPKKVKEKIQDILSR